MYTLEVSEDRRPPRRGRGGGLTVRNSQVKCETVDDVKLPKDVEASAYTDLAGAVPTSVGDLGPSLTRLTAERNEISSLPTEIGALTALTSLNLNDNLLTTLPAEIAALTSLQLLYLNDNQIAGELPEEFRTFNPSTACYMQGSNSFSCANVGASTTCCTTSNSCGVDLSGGECYSA